MDEFLAQLKVIVPIIVGSALALASQFYFNHLQTADKTKSERRRLHSKILALGFSLPQAYIQRENARIGAAYYNQIQFYTKDEKQKKFYRNSSVLLMRGC